MNRKIVGKGLSSEYEVIKYKIVGLINSFTREKRPIWHINTTIIMSWGGAMFNY